LRSAGSSIGAEAELVSAWLAVIAARCGGRPASSLEVDPDCAGVPFSATVLLPLSSGPGRPGPASGDLLADGAPWAAHGGQLRAGAGANCAAPSLRDDEPAPVRIRERLQALYGTRRA